MEDIDIHTHNAAAEQLIEDFQAGRNRRVPITFATDEAVWLDLLGHSFREFYCDPAVQIKVQLEGKAWFAENIVHDGPVGPPEEHWTVSPRWWMACSEFFGCEVVIQEDDFAWSKPLDGGKENILSRVRDIDPAQRVRETHLRRLYEGMRETADGATFRDRPVRVVSPGGSSHGIFTEACRVRGLQQMCMDLVEDPEFAHEFLDLITKKLIERTRAWRELDGEDGELPRPSDWGSPDDSLQLISSHMYEEFVLPRHERMYSAMTTGKRNIHLCGRAEQHYRALCDRLGIRTIDGPGTFVDHGKWLTQLPELRINAQTNHTTLMLGPDSAIEEMMRLMLTHEAKQPGRFLVMGFLLRGTPLSHVRAAYEAGKKYGLID